MLLPIAAEQKEDLGLERIAGSVGVEVAEEGVLFEDLQQQFGGQAFAEKACQRGFTDADGAFDCDVGVSGHGSAPCGASVNRIIRTSARRSKYRMPSVPGVKPFAHGA